MGERPEGTVDAADPRQVERHVIVLVRIEQDELAVAWVVLVEQVQVHLRRHLSSNNRRDLTGWLNRTPSLEAA